MSTRTWWSVACGVVLLTAQPAAAQEPRADAEKLIAACAQHCAAFELIHGSSMYYGGGVDDARQALATIQEVEAKVLPQVQPILAVFADHYGTSAMEVSNFFHKAGVTLDTNVGNRFDELLSGVENLDKSRRASAEAIALRVKSDTSYLHKLQPELKLKKLTTARELLLVGQQLDPANADCNAMLATIDADIQDTAAAARAEIDAARWKGNTGSFSGPGSAEPLAAAALDFFRSHPNWQGRPERKVRVLEAAVRGDWGVAETDLFGRVVSWRLPVELAITDAELEKEGVARVYELSVVTPRGVPGNSDKRPPFEGYWVGESWKMRLANLK